MAENFVSCISSGKSKSFCRARYDQNPRQERQIDSVHTEKANRQAQKPYGPGPDDPIYRMEAWVSRTAKELHDSH